MRSPFASSSQSVTWLCVFALLAISYWIEWCSGPLGPDHFVYTVATQKAWAGQDPYLPHHIGWGYFYPPPSLLLLEGLNRLSPHWIRPALFFISWSALAGVVAVLLMAAPLRRGRFAIAALLLTSVGVIESVYRGQVNLFVLLTMAVFWRAFQAEWMWVACIALGTAICLKLTPIVFAISLMTRRHWRWLVVVVVVVVLWFAAAAAVIPAGHLTTSFIDALRWASQQSEPNAIAALWNFSLSSSLPTVLQTYTRLHIEWQTMQDVKLLLLVVVLSITYAAYAYGSVTRIAFLMVCNVVMVLAPQLVWIHHFALLIPALVVVLVPMDDAIVAWMTLIACLCFQSARLLQVHVGIHPALPFACGQLLLLAAVILFLLRSSRHSVR